MDFDLRLRSRKAKCAICGREFVTKFPMQKYCDSPECREKVMAVKAERQRNRRHRNAGNK